MIYPGRSPVKPSAEVNTGFYFKSTHGFLLCCLFIDVDWFVAVLSGGSNRSWRQICPLWECRCLTSSNIPRYPEGGGFVRDYILQAIFITTVISTIIKSNHQWDMLHGFIWKILTSKNVRIFDSFIEKCNPGIILAILKQELISLLTSTLQQFLLQRGSDVFLLWTLK